MVVLCVLRSDGPVFDARWVRSLRAGVAEYTDVEVVCLTDDPGVPEPTVPLRHAFPGWWSKVEMFRPGLTPERVLYVDLDTLVVGDVGSFGDYDGRLAFLGDFHKPAQQVASGVVLFDGADPPPIYETFLHNPDAIMRAHRTRSDYWYQKVAGGADRIQTLFPGAVLSYKKHCRQERPTGATLVCGHGQPRFSEPGAGWAHKLWKERLR